MGGGTEIRQLAVGSLHGAPSSKEKRRQEAAFFTQLSLVLALLVGHSAGGLAGGLARCLALAATAMGRALLQGCAVQSLDVSH